MKFPILRKGLHYLDNAATTQKPEIVMDTLKSFYENSNANVHRGIYALSEHATSMLEDARETFARFIKAHPEEIIFTKSATEGFNLLATSISRSFRMKGKNIVTSEMEHHSNFIPFQQIPDAELRVVRYSEGLTPESFASKIDQDTIIATFTGMSNATGLITPAKGIIQALRNKNPETIIIIDATQLAAHSRIDVRELDADFLCFSAHKVYGTLGVGILWGRKELLRKMSPYLYGGNMIDDVSIEKTEWTEIPYKFEAGTIDAAGIIASAAAITSISENFGENNKREESLRDYALKRLKAVEGLDIIGHDGKGKYGPIISFTMDRIHPHDLATVCDKYGICIRAGHHCAQPLMKALGVNSTARISLSFYNTEEDIDALTMAVEEAKRILK
jgi:cysteine desulfurase / selenocysteine lyase